LKLNYFEEFRIYELSDSEVVPRRTERYRPALICCLTSLNPADKNKIENVLNQQRSTFWNFATLDVSTESVAVIAKAFECENDIPTNELEIIRLIEKEFLNSRFLRTEVPDIGIEFVRHDIDFTRSFSGGMPILNQEFFRKPRKTGSSD
jgi:hypothetical protein